MMKRLLSLPVGDATARCDFKKEVAGGVTTFLTMVYIVVVNPAILSGPAGGIPFPGALTATVLLCVSMTFLMGAFAKLPFAVAPGMGVNAFFAFTLIEGKQIPWPVALGIVFWAGIVFLLVSVTPLRVKIAQAIPHHLRIAAAAGIGLFLTFIGLKNGRVIEADPHTFVRFSPLQWPALLCFSGVFMGAGLLKRKSAFAFVVPILFISVVAWLFGLSKTPEHLFQAPDFQSAFFKLDMVGALKLAFLPSLFAILFTDLFDSLSTFVGVAYATGLVDEKGEPKRLKEGLIVDAWATLTAGLFGTSSGTAYIESASGIEVGGRTGWSAIVTGICFLPCLWIAPIAESVPAFATAPVLILVGSLMFRSVLSLSREPLEQLVPAFLTIVLIPLTFSITQGILWGFIAHIVLFCLCNRAREISATLWAIAACCGILLYLETV